MRVSGDRRSVQDVQAHGVPDQRVLSAVSLRREGLRVRRDERRLRLRQALSYLSHEYEKCPFGQRGIF